MEKSRLRKNAKTNLLQVSTEERTEIESALAKHLFSSEFWRKAEVIGITVSQQHEWNTKTIIDKAWLQDKKVCVPKCYPNTRDMMFYQLAHYDQLESVYVNLLEPKVNETRLVEKRKIDLLIVPGLLFDVRGFRIGYGGGYYDRYLREFEKPTVSMAIEKQLVAELPTEPFDIPVDYIITEQGLRYKKSFT